MVGGQDEADRLFEVEFPPLPRKPHLRLGVLIQVLLDGLDDLFSEAADGRVLDGIDAGQTFPQFLLAEDLPNPVGKVVGRFGGEVLVHACIEPERFRCFCQFRHVVTPF